MHDARPLAPADSPDARAQLDAGSRALGVTLTAAQLERLLGYAELLLRWRRVYNLVAASELPQVVSHHLLDSLAAVAYVRGPEVIDLGSGAGLPGLPLAIARPQLRLVLLDANAKRTRFLHQAVHSLALRNVEVVRARAETYNPGHAFDTAVARALAGLGDIARLAAPLLGPHGEIVALKGRLTRREQEQLPVAGYGIDDTYAVQVPGLEQPRRIVRLRRAVVCA